MPRRRQFYFLVFAKHFRKIAKITVDFPRVDLFSGLARIMLYYICKGKVARSLLKKGKSKMASKTNCRIMAVMASIPKSSYTVNALSVDDCGEWFYVRMPSCFFTGNFQRELGCFCRIGVPWFAPGYVRFRVYPIPEYRLYLQSLFVLLCNLVSETYFTDDCTDDDTEGGDDE